MKNYLNSEYVTSSKNFVIKKINSMVYKNRQSTNEILARLRHGVGKSITDTAQTWDFLLDDMPGELMSATSTMGTTCEETEYEKAIFIALTNYAWHQQGKDIMTQNMHRQGITFGKACAELAKHIGTNKVLDRIRKIAGASTINRRSGEIRNLIMLFKRYNIALDYGLLTSDLCNLQTKDKANKICFNWAEYLYK